MVDWKTVETEYVTTDISHRQLAEKYGICRSTISKKAADDQWSEKRNKHRAKTVSAAVNAVGKKQADRTARLFAVSDRVLDQVQRLLETGGEALVAPPILKDISVILKNIKDVQMIKSAKDLEEQDARIAKLRIEANPNQGDNAPKLVVEGLPEEFKV